MSYAMWFTSSLCQHVVIENTTSHCSTSRFLLVPSPIQRGCCIGWCKRLAQCFMSGYKTKLTITEVMQERYTPTLSQEIPSLVSKQQKRNLLTFHIAYPPRFMVIYHLIYHSNTFWLPHQQLLHKHSHGW